MNARADGSSGRPGDARTSWTAGGAVADAAAVALLAIRFLPTAETCISSRSEQGVPIAASAMRSASVSRGSVAAPTVSFRSWPPENVVRENRMSRPRRDLRSLDIEGPTALSGEKKMTAGAKVRLLWRGTHAPLSQCRHSRIACQWCAVQSAVSRHRVQRPPPAGVARKPPPPVPAASPCRRAWLIRYHHRRAFYRLPTWQARDLATLRYASKHRGHAGIDTVARPHTSRTSHRNLVANGAASPKAESSMEPYR